MEQWTRDFLDKHNDTDTFDWQPLPAGDMWSQFNWIVDHSDIPWLEVLGIDVPYKTMLQEAQNLRDLFVNHRYNEDGHAGWRSLAIHGISAEKTNTAEFYGMDPATAIYTWTEIQDRCPVTVDFFRNHFPYDQYQRLRYMLLEPGGFIAPHSDNARSSVGAAVNISLNNPQGCRFTTEWGTIPFRDEGSVMMINNHYRHSVHNESTTDRFHIIVHGGWKTPIWQQLVVESYRKKYGG